MSVGTTHCLCVMSLREGGREGAARWIWSMDTEALFTPRQYARLISILNPNRDTTIRLVVAEAFGALVYSIHTSESHSRCTKSLL